MAITYVGGKGAGIAGKTGTTSVDLTTGLTGGSNSGVSAGDLVVVTVSTGTAGRAPATAVSGYTALTVQATTATTYDTNMQVSYKFMPSTPDTTVTIPAPGNNADGQTYIIQVFRGVDPDTPLDVTPTYATGSGTNNLPNPAAITPATAGAWIVVCGGGAAAAGGTYAASYLTNFLQYNGSDTNDGTGGAGYYTGWTSGSYDPAAFTGGSAVAVNSWGATTIALRPAPASAAIASAGTSTAEMAGQAIQEAAIASAGVATAAFAGADASAPPSADITFLGAVDNGGTTAALDLTPLNLQEGDFLLAVATDDNGTGGPIGSPWTSLYSARPVSTSGHNDYLICGPTPPTSVDFPGNVSGVVVAFRGVDTTTPFDVTAPDVALATSGMPNPPAITTVTDGAVIVIVGHLDDDSTIGATIAAPADYTLAGWGGATALSGSDSITMVAYRTLATAGTDDPGAFTSTGGTDDWLAHTYALRPGVTGPEVSGAIASSGTSTAAMAGQAIKEAAIASTGAATAAMAGQAIQEAAIASAGTSTAAMAASVLRQVSGGISSSGVATAAMAGQAIQGAAIASAGVATADVASQTFGAGAIAAAGVATAAMAGQATKEAAIASSGTSTAAFAGTDAGGTIVSGAIASSGTSTAAMAGQAVQGAAIAAAGVATAAMAGETLTLKAGAIASAGVATAAAAGQATKGAAIASAGVATAAVAAQIAKGAAIASAGVATAAAAAQITKEAAIASAGVATAAFGGGEGATVVSGAIAAVGTSTAAMAGQTLTLKSGAIASTGTSTSSVASQAVRTAAISADGSSAADMGGGRTAQAVIASAGVATAVFSGYGIRVVAGSISAAGSSTAAFASPPGWTAISDAPDVWAAKSDTPATWAPATAAADAWTPKQDVIDTWAATADTADVWTPIED